MAGIYYNTCSKQVTQYGLEMRQSVRKAASYRNRECFAVFITYAEEASVEYADPQCIFSYNSPPNSTSVSRRPVPICTIPWLCWKKVLNYEPSISPNPMWLQLGHRLLLITNSVEILIIENFWKMIQKISLLRCRETSCM